MIFKFTNFFSDEIHQKIHTDLENSLNWGLIQNSGTNSYPETVPVPMKNLNKTKSQYNPKFWINILGGTQNMINNLDKHNSYYEVDLFKIIKNKLKLEN